MLWVLLSTYLASYGQAELGFLTEYIGCGFQLGPSGLKECCSFQVLRFLFEVISASCLNYWAVLFSFVSLFLILREFMKSVFGDMICRLDDGHISPAVSLL